MEKKSQNGDYLDLEVPSIKLPDGVVIPPVTKETDLGELTMKELHKEVKRIRKKLDTTADDFDQAHR